MIMRLIAVIILGALAITITVVLFKMSGNNGVILMPISLGFWVAFVTYTLNAFRPRP